MSTRIRYRLLRHLPGIRGQRYSRKYNALLALDEFDRALRTSAETTCIDLGANVGKYTRQMASIVREVIAFEPDPWTAEQLRTNLADLTNVRIERVAAGIREGTALLWRHERFEHNPEKYSTSSSTISDKFDDTAQNQAIEVPIVNFADYICSLDRDIGVIKIDIEGAEVEILEALMDRPALLSRIDHIFVETHERQIPGQAARVHALRTRIAHMDHPYINLDWH